MTAKMRAGYLDVKSLSLGYIPNGENTGNFEFHATARNVDYKLLQASDEIHLMIISTK